MKKSEPKLGEKIVVKAEWVKYYKDLLSEITSKYKDSLDDKTSIQILQSHGRFKECLEFAEKLGKHEEIILNYINEKDYAKAVHKIISYISATTSSIKVNITEDGQFMQENQITSMIDFILKHSKELVWNKGGSLDSTQTDTYRFCPKCFKETCSQLLTTARRSR